MVYSCIDINLDNCLQGGLLFQYEHWCLDYVEQGDDLVSCDKGELLNGLYDLFVLLLDSAE